MSKLSMVELGSNGGRVGLWGCDARFVFEGVGPGVIG